MIDELMKPNTQALTTQFSRLLLRLKKTTVPFILELQAFIVQIYSDTISLLNRRSFVYSNCKRGCPSNEFFSVNQRRFFKLFSNLLKKNENVRD